MKAIALSICLALAAFAQAPSPTQFSQDLAFVANELPQLHPNLFLNVTRAEFDAGVRRLESEAPRLSPEQFYTRLSALVASARDGHTSIYLESAQAQPAGFVLLPIEFRWFADGIFVTATAPDQSALHRARLIHINGVPIAEVSERLESVVPHENDYFFRYRAPSFLRNAGILRGLGLTPLTGPIRFGLRLETGEETAVDLFPGPASLVQAVDMQEGYLPAWITRSDENYWSEYWPHAKTLYIRWKSLHPMPSRPPDQFAAATLALLDRNPVETVVLDFRGNLGGSTALMLPLYLGLTQRITALKADPNFRIYGLSDGGTYSSGLFAIEFLALTSPPPELGTLAPDAASIQATIAGEPTGGKPAHFGETKNFTLPGSKIPGQYSTRYWPLWPGIPDRDAIYPDLPVELRSTDYFARHDPVLAAVMAHAPAVLTAPSGTALVVNSASFRRETGIAPGSFASAFGAIPSGTIQVTVDGRAATIVAAAPAQVNFLVPAGTPPGPATLEVWQGGQVAATGQFQVTTAGPGIFVTNAALGSQPGAVLNQDNSLNSRDAAAARGSVVQIYGTGYGPLNGSGEAEVEVWIAERPAAVLYSGPAPGYPGLWQINARVPDEADVAGQVPVCLKAHGLVSNGVTVFVQR
ncbi:MAG: hypothetical protein ACE141_18225 [Bryobacteraceae bacterium]